MEIDSIGYQTELGILSHDAEIKDRGDYIVIETPMNPGFVWGNYLLFRDMPDLEGFKQWRAIFKREFGSKVKHEAYGWDSPALAGSFNQFEELGFQLENNLVLARTAYLSSLPQKKIVIRSLVTDGNWSSAVQNHLGLRTIDDPLKNAERERFITTLFQRFRKLSETGKACWFGAFLDSQLVGTLGICKVGRLGRFQEVVIHREFRGKGIGRLLVANSMARFSDRFEIERYVVVAEPNSVAARLYRGLGFIDAGMQQGILLP